MLGSGGLAAPLQAGARPKAKAKALPGPPDPSQVWLCSYRGLRSQAEKVVRSAQSKANEGARLLAELGARTEATGNAVSAAYLAELQRTSGLFTEVVAEKVGRLAGCPLLPVDEPQSKKFWNILFPLKEELSSHTVAYSKSLTPISRHLAN